MTDMQQVYRYDLSYYGGSDRDRSSFRACIGLRDKGGRLIGAVYFHDDGAVHSPPAGRTERGVVMLNYPMASYAHVLDILRNEKPVFLRYRDGDPPAGSIDTSIEPVGESSE